MNMKKKGKKGKTPPPMSSRRHVREVWYGCACVRVAPSDRLVFVVGLVRLVVLRRTAFAAATTAAGAAVFSTGLLLYVLLLFSAAAFYYLFASFMRTIYSARCTAALLERMFLLYYTIPPGTMLPLYEQSASTHPRVRTPYASVPFRLLSLLLHTIFLYRPVFFLHTPGEQKSAGGPRHARTHLLADRGSS